MSGCIPACKIVTRLQHVWLDTSVQIQWQSCCMSDGNSACKYSGKVSACLVIYQLAYMVARLLHVWLDTSMHKWWQHWYIHAWLRACMKIWWQGCCMSDRLSVCNSGGKVVTCLIGCQHENMVARFLHVWLVISMQLWWQGCYMSDQMSACNYGGKVDACLVGYQYA